MTKVKHFHITREKHLDHMVKVVPFLVLCYAVQCFMIMKISPTEFSTMSLFFLGGFLSAMIAGFITYDLKHQVFFGEMSLKSQFFGSVFELHYQDVTEVIVKEPKESFTTLTLKTRQGQTHTFYFVDNADSIKAWIENKKNPEQKLAA